MNDASLYFLCYVKQITKHQNLLYVPEVGNYYEIKNVAFEETLIEAFVLIDDARMRSKMLLTAVWGGGCRILCVKAD